MLREHFDRVVIINLARRSDRQQETIVAFQRIGEVIDGTHVAFVQAIECAERGHFSSRGARGCFMSHLRELKRAQADGVERLLLCEDDVTFSKDFVTRATPWLERFRREPWGILYLAHRVSGFRRAREKVGKRFKLRTTSCYAVHRDYLAPLVEFLETLQERPVEDPRGGPMEFDGALNHFRKQHPDCVTYVMLPTLVTQRSSSSDIHPQLYDRFPPLRRLADSIRARLRNLSR